ncbi:MAG TPA: autoinducer binding domain-containing protein [Allosphingosinicella sp.]|nr:autoinducer binding domain-containing protein [Allosphingosinicella sp.]
MRQMIPGTGAKDLLQVQEFVTAVRRAETLPDLRSLIQAVSLELGIDHYLFASHVDFGNPPRGAVAIGNYPREWVARAREKGAWRTDPILAACEKTSAGFVWSDLGKLIALSPRQREFVREAQRFGLADGFSVPNHVPGELLGSCHFAVGPGASIADRNISMLQTIACFGFEAARQMSRDIQRPVVLNAPLTDRQRDCLLLSAKGKSDATIAQLLGLRPRTVNEHMEGAKRRYCVATRQQLIVRALFASQITFSEVLQ